MGMTEADGVGALPEPARTAFVVVDVLSTNADPPSYLLPPARFRRDPSERTADRFVPGSWGWPIVEGLEPRDGGLETVRA